MDTYCFTMTGLGQTCVLRGSEDAEIQNGMCGNAVGFTHRIHGVLALPHYFGVQQRLSRIHSTLLFSYSVHS